MHGNCKHSCRGKFWKIGIFVIIGIAALGLVVMLLWNWLMPALFTGAHTIGYLQALGLLVLSKILFGGFRHGCHGRWHGHHRWHGLSEEERARLKASGCGCGSSADAAAPEQKAE